MAILLALTGLAVFKHVSMGGLVDSKTDEGLTALVRGIHSDDVGAYQDAIDSFRDAASHSVADFYPAFLLQSTGRLRELEAGTSGHREGDAVLRSILREDFEEASRLAEEIGEPGSKKRDYYRRFVRDLRQASSTNAS